MKTRKENRRSFIVTLTMALFMATMLMACSSKAAPEEETKGTEATAIKEETVEVAEVKEEEPTPEPTVDPTPEPTPKPTPEPIVYEGIDMNSTLPGAEWAKTFEGIINEPKFFIFNDSTNKKVIVEQGQEVEFEETDSVGIYIPEGEAKLGQIDKNGVFSNYMPGNLTIMKELWIEYKNKETAVVESDITFNGEEMTLTATLILK